MQVLRDVKIPPYIVFPNITVILCDLLVFVSVMNVTNVSSPTYNTQESQRSAPPYIHEEKAS